MSVLITRSAEECFHWQGIAVVFDILNTSTTLCALVRKTPRNVLVCPEVATAQGIKTALPDLAVFSEVELPFSAEENSPYLAGKISSRKPALVVTEGMGKALLALRKASAVVVGGFCNFEALADWVAVQKEDVLLVPASYFSTEREEEDILCAEAFKDYIQGVGTPQRALGEFGNTVRLAEFREHGPKTAAKDLKLALKIDGISVVPQVLFPSQGNWAVCFAHGEQPEASWLSGAAFSQGQEFSQPSADAAMPSLPPDPVADNPAEGNIEEDRQPSQKTRSRLKGFFSEIVRSVKEEKAELEESLRQAATGQKRTYTLKSDDPMDALLKKTSGPAPTVRPGGHAFAGKTEEPSAKVAQASGNSGRNKKAIVLFSGGLDSTTCLYWALAQGYTCEALTVSYGQRHLREVVSAQAIARRLGVKHHLIDLNLPWLAASSLVDVSQPLPDIAVEKIPQNGIPSTYVPGRNLMFMSIAGSLLDTVEADAIIAGPNAVDFSGYPDCTPAFFKAAAEALNRGTRRGVEKGIEVLAPLMHMSKADIVTLAAQLKVPFELTWSCYAGGEKPCGQCDSCKLRAKGFADAGVHDTALD